MRLSGEDRALNRIKRGEPAFPGSEGCQWTGQGCESARLPEEHPQIRGLYGRSLLEVGEAQIKVPTSLVPGERSLPITVLPCRGESERKLAGDSSYMDTSPDGQDPTLQPHLDLITS